MAASEIDGARDFNLRMAQLQADTNLKTLQVREVEPDCRLGPARVIVSAFPAGAVAMAAAGANLGFFLGRGH